MRGVSGYLLLCLNTLWLHASCGRTDLLAGAVDGGAHRAQDTGGSGRPDTGAPETGKDARSQPDRPDSKSQDLGVLKLLAGSPGGPGSIEGVGANARFHTPHGIALDEAGNIFIADMDNCTIRKLVIATGEVTTLAGFPEAHGSRDGTGAEARFYFPNGLASDGAGGLFVADTDNNTIRQVNMATGKVTTLAGSAMQFGSDDGRGAEARFYLPAGIASDRAGRLFVADTFNHAIRQVVIASGEVTTLAGAPGETGNRDGTGAAARFFYPTDVASDEAGNLFIADGHGQVIRKLVVASQAVTTLAGATEQPGSINGDGRAARFNGLHGMVSDGAGSLFIADSENRTLRRISLSTGLVSLFAGSPGSVDSNDGVGTAARFGYPYGLARDRVGNLYLADADNHAIRKTVIATAEVTTLAGAAEHAGNQDGIGAAARLDTPTGMAVDDGQLFVADTANHCIRRIRMATGQVTTLAGSPGQADSRDGIGSGARFFSPTAVASDGAGHLLVADSGNRTIRKLVMATGEVTTLAGSPGQEGSQDGRGAGARFSRPQDVACDGVGLFVTDSDQHTIRKIVLATGEVTTLAGSPGSFGSTDGIGPAARFDIPHGIACDGTGNLFVADFGNYTIRKIVIATGQVTTLAGTPQQPGSTDGLGQDALFALPTGLACDGANLFIADAGNHAVRKIALASGAVTTVVGSLGRAGVILGPLPAGLNEPSGLALDPSGQLILSLPKENAILVAQF